MSRKYNFDLPYVMSSWKEGFAIHELQNDGIWDKLPHKLRDKIQDCYDNSKDLEITGRDCDSLDDETWEAIAEKLGLDWEDE